MRRPFQSELPKSVVKDCLCQDLFNLLTSRGASNHAISVEMPSADRFGGSGHLCWRRAGCGLGFAAAVLPAGDHSKLSLCTSYSIC